MSPQHRVKSKSAIVAGGVRCLTLGWTFSRLKKL